MYISADTGARLPFKSSAVKDHKRGFFFYLKVKSLNSIWFYTDDLEYYNVVSDPSDLHLALRYVSMLWVRA